HTILTLSLHDALPISHDFWEFICVDKGDVAVTGGDRKIILNRGEVAFHQPGEFHDVQATGKSAPNLVVISFQCDSPAMDFFRGKDRKSTRLKSSHVSI